jgi:hypothetical protein
MANESYPTPSYRVTQRSQRQTDQTSMMMNIQVAIQMMPQSLKKLLG